jgi:hypothetical protein
MDRLSKCVSLICCALLLTACGGGDGDDVADNDGPPFQRGRQNVPEKCGGFVSTLTIKDRMQQPVSSFIAGEPITFEMQITNGSSNVLELSSGSECTQGFYVTDRSNNTVWYSGDGVACTMEMRTHQLAPGASISFSRQWTQTNRSGQPVPAGQYTVYTADSTECSGALDQSEALSIQ